MRPEHLQTRCPAIPHVQALLLLLLLLPLLLPAALQLRSKTGDVASERLLKGIRARCQRGLGFYFRVRLEWSPVSNQALQRAASERPAHHPTDS